MHFTLLNQGTVRTAVKLLHPHGSDEAGISFDFITFLKGKELRLATYHESHFNILFYDATALFFHKDDIDELLQGWPDPNRLVKVVKEDLTIPIPVVGIWVLRIIDKLITMPYWRLIETKGSILEINIFLLHMKITSENWCKDASPMLYSQPMLL